MKTLEFDVDTSPPFETTRYWTVRRREGSGAVEWYIADPGRAPYYLDISYESRHRFASREAALSVLWAGRAGERERDGGEQYVYVLVSVTRRYRRTVSKKKVKS